jgi:hypothetical protein
MLKTLTPLLGAVLLAATTALYAQTPPSTQAPAAKEERRAKMKEAHQKARSACEGKQGQEHRDCMRKEMCAQSKDAAKCEAHFKERSAAFNKAYDSCKGKATGDEFRSCMHEYRVREKK